MQKILQHLVQRSTARFCHEPVFVATTERKTMTFLTSTGKPLPQHIVDSAASAGDSDVSRREFLA
ncbi:MAG: hypothetical protein ACI84R_004226, partial [Candidatus Azotimanducaceae bacterium]